MTLTELLPPSAQLANLLGQAQTWAEVETAIAAHLVHKVSAWQLLSESEKTRIKELKQRATEVQLHHHTPAPDELPKVGKRALIVNKSFANSVSAPDELLKVGERVWWDECFGNPSSWNPFVIRQILGDVVWLDYVAVPVHRSKLTLWNGGQCS